MTYTEIINKANGEKDRCDIWLCDETLETLLKTAEEINVVKGNMILKNAEVIVEIAPADGTLYQGNSICKYRIEKVGNYRYEPYVETRTKKCLVL